MPRFKTGLGIDSHRFNKEAVADRDLLLAGVRFESDLTLDGNSDADVVLHALTDAISSITGKTIIGAKADDLCRAGTTDSRVYLALALADLKEGTAFEISHVALTLECLKPKIDPQVPAMRASIAQLLSIPEDAVGITATSGEGLTDCGRGLGIQCTAIVSVFSE
ncbi:MAG: 2-C-methyl-D-erythritol 2,4-cyclodiphosphate synthase [Puniceicoccaceae bacterium]|nr:2-C-methyl-D-erythritol 2,4-cyclodiphosphate synthase [Puniceicoccaceae bacterium]